MRRYLSTVLLVLLMATGCSDLLPAPNTPPPPNQLPAARLDSVSATKIFPGDRVTFAGHGEDPDGSIIAYKWWSSNDGDLSTEPSFSTTTLSPGSHSIWFKVQDNQGSWSKEVSSKVEVMALSEMLPVIHSFELIPREIGTGKSTTLSWDVFNASHIEIDNYIGTVPDIGNKKVSPSSNTEYKITASNKNGSVTAKAGVTILTKPLYATEINAIAAECGSVRADGVVGPEPQAGVALKVHSGVAIEAFLSYDLSSIPRGKKIKSAYLDVTDAKLTGDPFQFLGNLYFYVYGYDQLSSRDYLEAFTGTPIYTARRFHTRLLGSDYMTEAVQTSLDSGSRRFQLRAQYSLCKCRQEDIGWVDFSGNGARLVVQYQD
jgi:hypothetical protein